MLLHLERRKLRPMKYRELTQGPIASMQQGWGTPKPTPFYCLNILIFIPSYLGKIVQAGKIQALDLANV